MDRIPAYATRVVQDERSKDYTAQFWNPKPYVWHDNDFALGGRRPALYEAHVGMHAGTQA